MPAYSVVLWIFGRKSAGHAISEEQVQHMLFKTYRLLGMCYRFLDHYMICLPVCVPIIVIHRYMLFLMVPTGICLN